MPKVGKTTLAAQADDCLLLAFERGYNAIDGIIPQDVTNWAEMKQVYRELKKPEVKEKFKTIIVDTVDLAAKYCTKYICQNNDIQDLGDIPYGKGYALMRSEFEDVFNGLAQMGYAIIFLGHDELTVVTTPTGEEYNMIAPALSPVKVRAIIENMADIFGYAHITNDGDGKAILTIRDNSGMIKCGSRFKHMRNEIIFDYDSLVAEINRAIDVIADGGADIVDEPIAAKPALNFDALMAQFNDIVNKVISNVDEETFNTVWGPKITHIVESVLGNGKKVSDLKPAQASQLDLIISELIDELNNGL